MPAPEPSRFLHQQVEKLDASLPVLDAPCGFGRNSLFLARQGYNVVGVDIDVERVNFLRRRAREDEGLTGNLNLIVCDLDAEILPLEPEVFGSVVVVHFIPSRWPSFSAMLRSGGLLVFETMGGQGKNYLELPVRGQMRTLLGPAFKILVCREQLVGPPRRNAVTVRLVAQKQ
jgi:SAM-dependent methyltransferase